MPSYHIWIRKEDEAKWKAIENKPEWLHEHLNHKELHFTRYANEAELAEPTITYRGELFVGRDNIAAIERIVGLEEQFNAAGGKEVITEIAGSDIDVAQEVLNALNEPTITEPEDVA